MNTSLYTFLLGLALAGYWHLFWMGRALFLLRKSSTDASIFSNAIVSADIQAAKRLIASDIDLNAKNHRHETPLYTIFQNCIVTINSPNNHEPMNERALRLIELLSWYLYHTCTNTIDISQHNHATLLEYLNSTYQASPGLQQASPLLNWIMTHMLDCRSKTQLIEKIIEHLETTEESTQSTLIENMRYVLSKEDILEEFHSHFNEFKSRFSLTALDTLNTIFRYIHAQKLKRKIFNGFNKHVVNQLMQLNNTQIEKNSEYIHILLSLHKNLIRYCNNSKTQSPFVKTIIEKDNQSAETKKIIELTKEYFSTIQSHTRELSAFSSINISSILKLIKDVKIHLDYIIHQKGASFNSSSLFGRGTGKDILLPINEEYNN